MNVGELKALLANVDDERIVVMSKDAEGNGYSPLSNMWQGAYRAETTWFGEVGLERLTPEDEESGYRHEDVISDGAPALILSPVN